MQKTAKRVTMTDIARKVGVTQQAVSAVLNGTNKSRVSGETRTRILTAARELKFRPNYLARSLKAGKTDTIGFLGERLPFDGPTAILNSMVAAGIEEGLPEGKGLVILAANSSNGLSNALRIARQGMVDGLIVNAFPMHYDELEHTIAPALREMGLPFVVTHPTAHRFGFPAIGVNREQAGYLMARDLINKDITDIDVFVPWQDRPEAMAQHAGVCRALQEHNLPAGGVQILNRNMINGDAWQKLIRGQGTRRQRGIVFPSIQAARAARRILGEHGVRIPDDVHAAVFGSPHSIELNAPSTLCGYSLQEQGSNAVQLLMALLDGDVSSTDGQEQILEPVIFTDTSREGV